MYIPEFYLAHSVQMEKETIIIMKGFATTLYHNIKEGFLVEK